MDDTRGNVTERNEIINRTVNIKRPRTLREKFEWELDDLYAQRAAMNQAAETIMSQGIASVSVGNRSVSYTSIDMLLKSKRAVDERINELEALLSGRAIRSVQTNVYLSPSIIVPRKVW